MEEISRPKKLRETTLVPMALVKMEKSVIGYLYKLYNLIYLHTNEQM